MNTIFNDDILEFAARYDGPKFHAVLCDPPYELSHDGKNGASRVFLEFAFPKNSNFDVHGLGDCNFALLIDKIFDLHMASLAPSPSSSVPEVSVTFNEYSSGGYVDVKNGCISATGISDRVTGHAIKAKTCEHLGSFALEFADASSILDALNSAGCGFDSGGFGIGFGILPSGVPGFLASRGVINDRDSFIRATDSAFSFGVRAGFTAKDFSVARLEFGRAFEDRLTTSAALVLFASIRFGGAKLIRTNSSAGCLSSKLQTRRISIVNPATNGAIAFDLVIHPQIVSSVGFMGKVWDGSKVAFDVSTWAAIRSLLVPGAHLLAFGGTRTFHRIAVAIEDAGFEIRDTIGWMYGSGFPKSHDVSKAIDREAGAERELTREGVVKRDGNFRNWDTGSSDSRPRYDAPSTDDAKRWNGYGTALKPAWEPVIVARNPLSGTVAQNALEHGAGALNVDGGRVGDELITSFHGLNRNKLLNDDGWSGIGKQIPPRSYIGRWPANIIHDGSDETAEVLGDAARFFYCAKPSSREREEGLDGFDGRPPAFGNESGDGLGRGISHTRQDIPRRNHHPTVKPIALTQYLATLIRPPQHVESRILVPFAGSGSECIGAALAGWDTIVGVEREAEYAEIARARLQHWAAV